MNQDIKTDLSVTTFNTVVVEKTKLLQTLEVNRDKHNVIYSAAISGYWIEAQQVLDKKRVEFSDALADLSTEFTKQDGSIQSYVTDQNKDKIGVSYSLGLAFNSRWPLTFPENHLEDYNRAIDLLNFSVADRVELSVQDFDAYVRNNWGWRKGFLGTSSAYVTSYLNGFSGMLSASGSCLLGNIVLSGNASTYNTKTQLDRQF